MVTVIGDPGCGLCVQAKERLKSVGISFDYYDLKDLDSEDQKHYKEIALEADNLNLPIIIKDDKSMTVDEVIEDLG